MNWSEPSSPNGNPAAAPINVAATPAVQSDEFDLFVCVRVLLSYWWLIAPMVVASAGLGLAICFHAQPVYQARCRFEIFQNAMLQLGEDPSPKIKNTLGRHVLILEGGNLNNKVREKMAEKWRNRMPASPSRFTLEVKPVREAQNSMLDISVNSFDTQYSLEYLLALLDEYQEMRREEMALINENTLVNLRYELVRLATQLESAENQLAKFEADHNTRFNEQKSASDQALLANLMKRQSQLRTQLAILDAQFPFLREENAATLRDVLDLTIQLSKMDGFGTVTGQGTAAPDGWSEIPEWRENEATVIRLKAEYDNLLAKYKPGHARMKALNSQIEAAQRDLRISAEISLKRLQSIRSALKMQEDALLKAARESQMSMSLSAGDRAEYEKLNSRVEHLKGLHDKVFTRIIDSSTSTVDKFYSRIVDGPFALREPVAPVKWKIMVLTIVGGTSIGCFLILFVYFIKVKLYNLQPVEHALNISCLASIPKFPGRPKRGKPLDVLPLLDKKNDMASECYRSLRTNIEHVLTPEQNILMVTSPDPGEGKTFTALNLAVIFSWSRERVLIVDADFRRVTLRKFFPDAPREGFTDSLATEDGNWQDYVVKNVLPNVDYLPAGRTSQQATELLTLGRLQVALTAMADQYDIVVLDTAPVNRVVDSILLSKHADGVVLVAKAGKTTSHSLRYCFSRLSAAHIIGYVLNRVDASSRKYGYYSGAYGYSPYYQHRYYYRRSAEVESS